MPYSNEVLKPSLKVNGWVNRNFPAYEHWSHNCPWALFGFRFWIIYKMSSLLKFIIKQTTSLKLMPGYKSLYKINVSFSRNLDFVFLRNPHISSTVTPSNNMLQSEKYTLDYFFWILRSIEMRFGHILPYTTTVISYLF